MLVWMCFNEPKPGWRCQLSCRAATYQHRSRAVATQEWCCRRCRLLAQRAWVLLWSRPSDCPQWWSCATPGRTCCAKPPWSLVHLGRCHPKSQLAEVLLLRQAVQCLEEMLSPGHGMSLCSPISCRTPSRFVSIPELGEDPASTVCESLEGSPVHHLDCCRLPKWALLPPPVCHRQDTACTLGEADPWVRHHLSSPASRSSYPQ